MHFEYSVHAEHKFKERRISKSDVEEVLKGPEDVFLDIETGNLVAVGKSRSKKGHKLIIVYSPGKRIKVVTVIDTSRMEIIERREERRRWVKIR
jgi:hypothetical protein